MTRKQQQKKRAKTSTIESEVCSVSGCDEEPYPGSEYCFVHYMAHTAGRAAVGAFKKGNVGKGIAQGLASIFLTEARPLAQGLIQQAMQQVPFNRQPPGPQPRERANQKIISAFGLLGLDPKTSTRDVVRKRQKDLAKIFHTDKADLATDSGKMAEVNAAVDVALDFIGRRDVGGAPGETN